MWRRHGEESRGDGGSAFIGATPMVREVAAILGVCVEDGTRGADRGIRQRRRRLLSRAGARAGACPPHGGGGVWERLLLGLGRRGCGSRPWAGARWATRGGEGVLGWLGQRGGSWAAEMGLGREASWAEERSGPQQGGEVVAGWAKGEQAGWARRRSGRKRKGFGPREKECFPKYDKGF